MPWQIYEAGRPRSVIKSPRAARSAIKAAAHAATASGVVERGDTIAGQPVAIFLQAAADRAIAMRRARAMGFDRGGAKLSDRAAAVAPALPLTLGLRRSERGT